MAMLLVAPKSRIFVSSSAEKPFAKTIAERTPAWSSATRLSNTLAAGIATTAVSVS
jgi:hypothetical protein